MIKTILDVDIEDKSVFLRVDLNVPINESTVQDDFKIISILPTIRFIHSRRPRSVVIGSHLGRPGGRYIKELSLRPVHDVLKRILKDELGLDLGFHELNDIKSNGIGSNWTLLENLRFNQAEEDASDPGIVSRYRDAFMTMDIAVVDAFGCLHRECGSIQRTGLRSYSGLLVEKELSSIKELMEGEIDLMILGGKKVSDKIKMLLSLGKRAKSLFIVGGLSYPFLRYLGVSVGNSIVDSVDDDEIKSIYDICKEFNTTIMLPTDFTVQYEDQVLVMNEIPSEGVGLDIGPMTIDLLKEAISGARSIFWNGPPGVFEKQEFSRGTEALVHLLEDMKGECFCGGGETASAIRLFGNHANFRYISTGGGVLMKILSGKSLPGLEFLENQ